MKYFFKFLFKNASPFQTYEKFIIKIIRKDYFNIFFIIMTRMYIGKIAKKISNSFNSFAILLYSAIKFSNMTVSIFNRFSVVLNLQTFYNVTNLAFDHENVINLNFMFSFQ